MWSLEFTSPRNDSSPCAQPFSHFIRCVQFCFNCFVLFPFVCFVLFLFFYYVFISFGLQSCRNGCCKAYPHHTHIHTKTLYSQTLLLHIHSFFSLCRRHIVCVFVFFSFLFLPVCAFVQCNIVSFSGRMIIMCSAKHVQENGNKFSSYEPRFVLYAAQRIMLET